VTECHTSCDVDAGLWNVDDKAGDPSRRVHTGVRSARTLVVENLWNLDALAASGFRFYADPLLVLRGASNVGAQDLLALARRADTGARSPAP